MASLERRAAGTVERSSYWSNDKTGKWRGLGRAQWTWHGGHGHSGIAAELKKRQPWETSLSRRTPVSFQYQLTREQRDMNAKTAGGMGGTGRMSATHSALSVVAEESGRWKGGTPSRMMGTQQTIRGWDRHGKKGSAAAHVSTHSRAKDKMISEIAVFEMRLKGEQKELSVFPGMRVRKAKSGADGGGVTRTAGGGGARPMLRRPRPSTAPARASLRSSAEGGGGNTAAAVAADVESEEEEDEEEKTESALEEGDRLLFSFVDSSDEEAIENWSGDEDDEDVAAPSVGAAGGRGAVAEGEGEHPQGEKAEAPAVETATSAGAGSSRPQSSSSSSRRSRPPSAKGWTVADQRAQIAHLSKLHCAAVELQRVARGWLRRRQARA